MSPNIYLPPVLAPSVATACCTRALELRHSVAEIERLNKIPHLAHDRVAATARAATLAAEADALETFAKLCEAVNEAVNEADEETLETRVAKLKYTSVPGTYGMAGSHRYSSTKGCISMVGPVSYTSGTFEIYCITGALFEDVERYETKTEALTRICELLK